MRSHTYYFGLGLCLLGMAPFAEVLANPVKHGQINWTEKTITVTGSAAPDLKAANAAVARLGAERAAKMDAFRNVLEAVKGIRVSGNQVVADVLSSSPQIKSKVEGVLQRFKVLDTKYYSDGGVDVIVEVPLDGILTETLISDIGKHAKPKHGSTPVENTGIIINAKGLQLTPSLAPKIFTSTGKQLYGADFVRQDAAKKYGVIGYSTSIEHAMKSSRVADNPLVLRAKKHEKNETDLVMNADDAKKLAALSNVLAEGRILVVID